mmetsp:Transcript_37688/g.38047  ORF Transcript_37688/g.38047 Transcript_37688/m.38047 type:complete len:93 (+) Transcript_37688:87-365(+)
MWELQSLSHHYHPAVSALAQTIGMEDDSTPLYDMEGTFLCHSYKSLFETEQYKQNSSNRNKKTKNACPVTFREPEGLFGKEDVFTSFLEIPS